MLLVIGTVLSFAFLEGVWRFLALVPLAVIEIAEIFFWFRLRRLRSITGAEALIGAVGRVVEDCAPDGQVRVKGQLWRAMSEEPVEAGDDVEVVAVDGMRLKVRARSMKRAV